MGTVMGGGVTSLRDCNTKLGSCNHSFNKHLFSNYHITGSKINFSELLELKFQ